MNASVHYLQHNDVFTIGQRKFKWKYPHKKDTENVEHTGEVMHVSDENDKVEKTPPNEVQELVSDKELATCDEIDFVNAVNTMGLSNYYTDTEYVEHTGESMHFSEENNSGEETASNEVQELVSDKEGATCDETDSVETVNTMGLSNYYTDTEDFEHTGESMDVSDENDKVKKRHQMKSESWLVTMEKGQNLTQLTDHTVG
ncbi:uncharacterized protein LOC123566206 [Mercenaria mercenaria]|uniref:uncharacterized protein LOC123566206 n=1 Tax=Mercenaria mercenaria TaxID=6596 RepID=UPI00234F7A29|nr:uncharacterized protein LOC123566206 [Mercenaria mercenaria]